MPWIASRIDAATTSGFDTLSAWDAPATAQRVGDRDDVLLPTLPFRFDVDRTEQAAEPDLVAFGVRRVDPPVRDRFAHHLAGVTRLRQRHFGLGLALPVAPTGHGRAAHAVERLSQSANRVSARTASSSGTKECALSTVCGCRVNMARPDAR
ncbi:hypothetical protein Lesp02_75100 [Lentzea sp. NBRC 105346]|nr:hypothetical protein Lesp02_75100 [Lentzea sp. NBRC 105346]